MKSQKTFHQSIPEFEGTKQSLMKLLRMFRQEILEQKVQVQTIYPIRNRSISQNLPQLMQHQKNRHSSQKEKSEIQLLPKLSVQEFNFGDVEKPYRNRKNKQIKLRNKK